jgi:hypothetical protein
MGHPYGADQSGKPGLLSTWSKMAATWITPILITQDGDYTLKAAHDNLDAYQIDITPLGSSDSEYFLIENRQPIGFEEKLWGSGLLITHVDDAADGMKNRGYKGQNGWPQNGNHYQVAIVPKDGNYDLERNENYGDATDLFVPGDMLGPGTRSGETVYPNTDSYQNGNIVETGLTIEVLSQQGTDITFRVGGVKPSEGGGPSPAGSPSVAAPTSPSSTGIAGDVPTSSPRWVLTRPPVITRAPFDFPEFPIQEPLSGEAQSSDAERVPFVFLTSLLLGLLAID